MIHPQRVVTRIVDLLTLSGISSDSDIEEMTDHYLTEIESAVSQGSTE